RRARVPIAIENVKGRSAIVEAVRTDWQLHSVDREKPQAVVALHRHAAGGKTNIRPMDFDKKGSGASWKPAEEIHHPRMAVRPVPGGATTFVVAEQIFRFGRDRHRFVSAFRNGPLCNPTRASNRLMTPVPGLHSGFGDENPKR